MKTRSILCSAGLFALALFCQSLSAFAAAPTMIGDNLSGGDFGSNMPGVLGTDYFYPSATHIDWTKSQGLELVRIPFRWERVQHDTDGVLDSTLWTPDINAIDASINLCEARGLRVILDMHNYAGRKLTIGGVQASYKIGTPELSAADYANAWRLLADHFKTRNSIWGYDIMNEPVGIATADWVTYAQAAVNAIREVDTTHAIILEGTNWAHTSSWATTGAPLLGVVDPSNNLIFSGHCYTDRDQSGTWSKGGSVTAELIPSVYPDLASAYQCGVDRVKPFVDWCVANNVRGLIGEYGSHQTIDTDNWNIVLDNMLSYMKNQGQGLISGTQWGGGAWNPTYVMRMENRKDHSEPPFMPIVRSYASGAGSNWWFTFTLYDEAIAVSADYSFSYAFASATPLATCAFNIADTTTFFSGTKSAHLNYTIPAGGYAGAGMHIRGPLTAGAMGGVDISKSVADGHVLSFYAKGTAGANPSVTLGTTNDANGVDSGSDTGTGNWVALSSIAPLTSTWQRYEIPLSAIVNTAVTGNARIQRLRIAASPADGATYDVNFDKITIGIPSTNTAPTVSVDTSTGGSSFVTGQTVTLVATAADAGGSIDYVEFFSNHEKIGIDDLPPYQWATSFGTAGTYDITAIAFDNFGVSTQSAVKTLTITPSSVPPAPTGLTATAGDAQVALSWTASSGATSYNVKRATVSGGPYTTIASPTTTSYTNTGLTNGTTYYYVVSAVNTAGESANSTQVSATPVAAPVVPPVPTGLAATAGDAQVALSWTASSGATSYNVKRATVSGGPYATIAGPTTTSYTNTGLTNGTTYYYVVSAVNAVGESANSAQASATPASAASTTISIYGTPTEDGWVLESTATSSVGGTFSNSPGKIRIGDDGSKKQYKGILSFDTSTIPAGATILSVTLQIKRDVLAGTDPFADHGSCNVDVITGGFNGNTALEAADFQAAGTATNVATMSNPTVNGALSTGTFNAAGISAINRTGKTQCKVSFALGDNNNNTADYLQFNASNDGNASKRPTLIITYQ